MLKFWYFTQVLYHERLKCLYHARLYHKAGSNSTEHYYYLNDTDFLFGPIYKLSKLHVIYANDS